MRKQILRFDGNFINGAESRGAKVFAAFDWRDMVLGPIGDPITKKAKQPSTHLRDFDPADVPDLTKRLHHYSDVQSSNGEDTVTWSVFANVYDQGWINTLLEEAFGAAHRPSNWSLSFWKRVAHPDTGLTDSGPEADVVLSAPEGWTYVIEAKWCSDIDDKQGVRKDKTQLDMRFGQASSLCKEKERRGVLVVAPAPAKYKALRKRDSIFARYFEVDGDGYSTRELGKAVEASCVTWEQVGQILENAGADQKAEFLNWRLGMLMTDINEPRLPHSDDELISRLRSLHEERKKLPRPPRRLSLTPQERTHVLGKTDARCHICGGEITENKFAADHVHSHAAGGEHKLANYVPAHGLCNGCRWFYSPEEVQWILRMGIWARKQMEDRTHIGLEMAPLFLTHEKAVRARRRKYEQGE